MTITIAYCLIIRVHLALRLLTLTPWDVKRALRGSILILLFTVRLPSLDLTLFQPDAVYCRSVVATAERWSSCAACTVHQQVMQYRALSSCHRDGHYKKKITLVHTLFRRHKRDKSGGTTCTRRSKIPKLSPIIVTCSLQSNKIHHNALRSKPSSSQVETTSCPPSLGPLVQPKRSWRFYAVPYPPITCVA